MVQSPEMLRLLVILTVADIRAVGPGVWNGWKGQLLRELYYAAENMMTGGDQAPGRGARVAAAKAALEARLGDFTPSEREKALTRHYDNYWLAFDEDELERHARLMAKADAEGQLLTLDASTNEFRAVTEIILYTPDNAGLFSQFAGAIAMSGGSIVDAKAFTTSRRFRAGRVLGAGRRRRGLWRQGAAGAAAPVHRKDPARRSAAAPRTGRARPCAARPAPSPSGPRSISTMRPRASPP